MNEQIELISRHVKMAEDDVASGKVPDEIEGNLRAAVGKAGLLMSKKFKQFRGLCQDNLVSIPMISINYNIASVEKLQTDKMCYLSNL